MISIIIPFFGNRKSLLDRTVFMLNNQTYRDFEVWLMCDGGDLIEYPYDNFHSHLTNPHGNEWRTPNYPIHDGYKMCNGDFVIITSPEAIPPKDALQIMMDYDDGTTMDIPMLYKLSRNQQCQIDTVDWKSNLDCLQNLENFWVEEEHPGGFPNYDAKYNYHHGLFVGASRKVWDEIKISPDSLGDPKYESDSYWHVRLCELGKMPIRLPFAVYHQWHQRKNGPKMSVRIERIFNASC